MAVQRQIADREHALDPPDRLDHLAPAPRLSTSTSVYAISPFDLFSMLWMLSPAFAIAVEIWPSMFGTFALAIATR